MDRTPAIARRQFLQFLAASPYVATVGGVSAFLQQAGARRHGERHDQPEQDLEQALGRVEVTMDEARDHAGPFFAFGRAADNDSVR